MKKLAFLLCLAGLALPVLHAQTDEVLMTVDGKPVTASEFLYIFKKNNQETASDPKSMDDYLQLFVNFKLKVAEAEAQGIDTTEAFAKELAGYRAQAAQKYLRADDAIDSLVRLSHHRMAHLRRARHIAVACPQNANDSMRAAAEAKIGMLHQKATPENFAELARMNSDDPSAKENGGELGWVIPFRYVYSFEDAIYTTPVGQVTPVFRSPYGLHIALVEEEEAETEEVQAAHIMKMVKKGDEASDKAAKQQIDSIYNLLKEGANFEETALQLSDDKGTAMRGGDLGWFSKGMMVKEFENTVYGLEEGGMSEPFRSQYGWHIAILNHRRKVQPLDSMRQQILRQVQRDQRMEEADRAFLRKTRREYRLNDEMSDEEVLAYADAHLEDKYEELRHLVKEYHDGILLFEISLRSVWDKASKDTAGLTAYFAEHKKEYTWDEPRYKGYIIYAKDKESAKRAQTIIKTANPDSVNSYIAHRINNDSTTLVRVDYGLWKKGQNPAIDKFGFRLKKTDYKASEAYPVVMACKGKVIKAPEEYTDERGKVTGDYQDMLEQQWVEELRQRHSVVINREVFDRLKNQ